MLVKTTYKMQPPLSVRIKSGHVLGKDLVCFLPMRERSGTKVFDASVRKRHGALQTGASWAIGKNGRAIDLNGTAGHVTIPSHADFSPILTPFSVSCNVYMHDATDFIIAGKGILFTNGEWLLYTKGTGKLYLVIHDESVVNGYISRLYDTDLSSIENTWLHIVGTYDGGVASSGIKLYLNGARVDDLDDTGAGTFVKLEALGEPVKIGRHDAKYSDGLVQDFMIYKRILTLNDVNELFLRNYRLFDQS